VAFVAQRVNSILKQTFKDFEIVCLDDASTDGSQEKLRALAQQHKFNLIINAENSGSPTRQWNKGVKAARGQYIWIAESDDYAAERFLEMLVPILDDNPTVGLAYAQSQMVLPDGKIQGVYNRYASGRNGARWSKNFRRSGRDECREYLTIENTIPNASAVLFRKKLYLESGGADERYRFCGDWDMWTKILLLSDIAFIAEPLNYFRVTAGRRRIVGHGNFIEEACEIVARLRENLDISEKELELSKQTLAYQFCKWLANNFFSAGVSRAHTYRKVKRLVPDLNARAVKILFNYLRKGQVHPIV